jgi:hypothetical protein
MNGNKDLKTDLRKAIAKAIAKAYRAGNPMAREIVGSDKTAQKIVNDIADPNKHADVPPKEVPANAEAVLHKDVLNPAQRQQRAVQSQKEAQAKAALGQRDEKLPSKSGQIGYLRSHQGNVVALSENAPEKGVGKLKKFMEGVKAKKR